MSVINSHLTAHELRESWGPTLALAAREVFSLMLDTHLVVARERFAEEELAITSIVGLAGQLCGVVTFRCSAESATRMAAKMLGVDAAEAGPEMWDAVGEVCNMIAGNFKNKIAGMGDGCMLSVPTVIAGADYTMRTLGNSGKTNIHLLFEGLPLIVSIEIHS